MLHSRNLIVVYKFNLHVYYTTPSYYTYICVVVAVLVLVAKVWGVDIVVAIAVVKLVMEAGGGCLHSS